MVINSLHILMEYRAGRLLTRDGRTWVYVYGFFLLTLGGLVSLHCFVSLFQD